MRAGTPFEDGVRCPKKCIVHRPIVALKPPDQLVNQVIPLVWEVGLGNDRDGFLDLHLERRRVGELDQERHKLCFELGPVRRRYHIRLVLFLWIHHSQLSLGVDRLERAGEPTGTHSLLTQFLNASAAACRVLGGPLGSWTSPRLSWPKPGCFWACEMCCSAVLRIAGSGESEWARHSASEAILDA